MSANMNWYVVYTRPRWEKKIAEKLDANGIEAYCPLNKVQRQWSDRKKTVHEPLFKGYVFVYVEEEHKWDIRKIDGIVNFIYWNGKPAIVRPKEIETIKKFLSEFSGVEVEEIKIDVKTKVKVFNHFQMCLECTIMSHYINSGINILL